MPSLDPSKWGDRIRDAMIEHEKDETESGRPSPVTPYKPARQGHIQNFKLGKYRLIRELGRGGAGIVYEALDTDLQRKVALKVLHGFEGRPILLTRFQREARIAASLKHNNIIGVHEIGSVQGDEGDRQHFISMELVEGAALSEKIESLSVEEKLNVLDEVLAGMAFAHSKGIIHRDLKPGNILMGNDGRVIIADFGLARAGQDAAQLTRTGATVGTLLYMAPEQVEGRIKDISPRTDVYALGVLLYQMLLGNFPYSSDTPQGIQHRILHDEPAPPRHINQAVSKQLEAITLKALEKDPAKRYESAEEFALDLKRYREGRAILASHYSPFRRWGKKALKRKSMIAASALGVLVLLVAVPLIYWKSMQATTALDDAGQARAIERAQTLWDEVRKAFGNGKNSAPKIRKLAEQARDVISQMVRDVEPHSRLYLYRGKICTLIGETKEAESNFQQALNLNPHEDSAWFGLGMLGLRKVTGHVPQQQRGVEFNAVRKKTLEEVLRHFEQVKKGTELELALGEIWRQWLQGNNAEAMALCDTWINVGGDMEEFYFAQGMARAASSREGFDRQEMTKVMQRLKDAHQDFNLGLQHSPHHLGLLLNRAELARAVLRNPRDAIADLTHLLGIDPEYVAAYFSRGRAYEDEGRDSLAFQDYFKTLELDPDYHAARLRLAWLAAKDGNFVRALEACDIAIAQQKDSPWPHQMRVRVLALMGGRQDEEMEEYSQIIEKSGIHQELAWKAHYSRAGNYIKRGELQAALQDMNAAVTIYPDRVFSLLQRGLVFEKLALHSSTKNSKECEEAALADYGKILQLNAKHVETNLQLGVFYSQKHEYDKAIEHYTVVLNQKSEVNALYNRGNCYIQIGKYEEAVEDFTAALNLRENHPDTLFHRARAYHAWKKDGKASVDVEAALKFAKPGWRFQKGAEGLKEELGWN